LWGSFAKETNNFKNPTDSSHPISDSIGVSGPKEGGSKRKEGREKQNRKKRIPLGYPLSVFKNYSTLKPIIEEKKNLTL